MPKREIGEVSNWFKQRGYGFVTREGRESSFASDIQLHIANAKGQRLKEYVQKHGLMLGAKIKYSVDYEENKGKAFAAQWELVDAPDFNGSRSRSANRERPGRARKSPSYGRARRSPSYGRARKSPSYGRGRKRSTSAAHGKAKRSKSRRQASGSGRRKSRQASRSSPSRRRAPSSASRSRSRSWSRRRPQSKSRG